MNPRCYFCPFTGTPPEIMHVYIPPTDQAEGHIVLASSLQCAGGPGPAELATRSRTKPTGLLYLSRAPRGRARAWKPSRLQRLMCSDIVVVEPLCRVRYGGNTARFTWGDPFPSAARPQRGAQSQTPAFYSLWCYFYSTFKRNVAHLVLVVYWSLPSRLCGFAVCCARA